MANLPWRVSVRLMALAKKIAMVIGIIVLVLLSVRVYLSQQGPALYHWHTWRADEMSVQEMDNATFVAYVARENAIFTALDAEVTAKVTPAERTPLNRYYRQSLVWPGHFSPDANRSFVLMPAGKPRGGGGIAARSDGFALQRQASGRELSKARLCGRSASFARTRHGTGRADRR